VQYITIMSIDRIEDVDGWQRCEACDSPIDCGSNWSVHVWDVTHLCLDCAHQETVLELQIVKQEPHPC